MKTMNLNMNLNLNINCVNLITLLVNGRVGHNFKVKDM